MQQRYYDPQIGRFLSVDPVSADTVTGWNFNRYNYAANNPYKFKDPDGRIIETAWDVFNIGLGVASFASNVSDCKYGAAALEEVGVGVDRAGGAVSVLDRESVGEGRGGAVRVVLGGGREHQIKK